MVSETEVEILVVLESVPVTKFGTTGWDLTGMAYNKHNNKSFFMNHLIVNSVTNCPVTVDPESPSCNPVIP